METTIPKLIQRIAKDNPDAIAQYAKDANGDFQPTSFTNMIRETKEFSAALLELGVKKGDHVGLISENRKEWLLSDLGIMNIGAADVPRGCDTMEKELAYILDFAECSHVIVENYTQFEKMLRQKDSLKKVSHVIIMDTPEDFTETHSDWKGVKLFKFSDCMAKGAESLAKHSKTIDESIAAGEGNDLATLIFTSGTTGTPKGVMLSHTNFLHQVKGVPELLKYGVGDTWLCVLPVWHSFERIMQYLSLGYGSSLAYSKPVGKIMLGDMAKIKPSWMASVPRIWEALKAGVYQNIRKAGGVKQALFNFFVGVGTIHQKMHNRVFGLMPRFRKRNRVLDCIAGVIPWLLLWPLRALGNVLVFGKIKAMLGGNFVAGISGGGALAKDVDEFFSAAGVLLLEGYGLTETAPVLGVRKQWHPVPQTIGPVFPGTIIQIRDEEGRVLPPGQKGIVFAKGPQVMLGYLKNEEATKAIKGEDGYLNTGDLGMLTWDNELAIVGRAKDTVVLSGGENVEPLPIEQKMQSSSFIHQAMVVGQDKKFLGALIVPNFVLLEEYIKENNLTAFSPAEIVNLPEVKRMIEDEVKELVSSKNGFRSFEQINRIALISEEFKVGVELSQKQEIKRHVITEKYSREIDAIFQ